MSIAAARTALFVPGDRPDRFPKAAATSADLIIVDLEDAVAGPAKAAARQAAAEAIAAGLRALVRIGGSDAEAVEDLAALASAGVAETLLGIVIPKAERPEQLAAVVDALGTAVALVPLIETAAGLARAEELASEPRVARLAFGALDFAFDVDATARAVLDHALIEIALASRRAGIAAPFNSPDPEFRDLEGVAERARASRALGCGGQLCIHPAQVDVVAAAYRPSPADFTWARRVVDSGEGVVAIDGAMVDTPVLNRARRILDADAPLP